jgi:hypothetical protein
VVRYSLENTAFMFNLLTQLQWHANRVGYDFGTMNHPGRLTNRLGKNASAAVGKALPPLVLANNFRAELESLALRVCDAGSDHGGGQTYHT